MAAALQIQVFELIEIATYDDTSVGMLQSNVVDTSDDVIKHRSVLGSWRVIDYPDHNAGKVARHSLRANGEPHSLQILAVQLLPVLERDATPDVTEDSTTLPPILSVSADGGPVSETDGSIRDFVAAPGLRDARDVNMVVLQGDTNLVQLGCQSAVDVGVHEGWQLPFVDSDGRQVQVVDKTGPRCLNSVWCHNALYLLTFPVLAGVSFSWLRLLF